MALRVYLAIDGSNFFHVQRDGLGFRIDPKKLLDYVRTMGDVICANYYLTVNPQGETNKQNYINALTHMGYSVEKKEVRVNPDGTLSKTDMDGQLIHDILVAEPSYDMLVLISGDGDFHQVLQTVKSHGKVVKVMSTRGFVAKELQDLCGPNFIDLEELKNEIERVE